MTDAYSLLNRELRFYIHEKGWPSLTRIQNASIKAFFTNENNLILSAATAQGKTEAAFLPAISKIKSWEKGIKIIYISPLIALINDQFKRISDMCFDMDIPITSWHGEASKSKKDKLIANPRGIVLITPESIEALLSDKSEIASKLFSEVNYIIVDEIHSFLIGNRGLQLRSLLERILRYTYNPPRMIGLSATIGEENYNLSKKFFNNGRDTNILVDKSANDLEITLDFFESDNISNDVIYKIYEYAEEGPMLVFPNARERVEAIAVGLVKIAKEKNSSLKIFAHHSSVSKNRRQEIEEFAKEARNENFVITATSTLELGIDIGAVHSVSQYGSAHSVLSLAQRLGRSGRKTGKSIFHQVCPSSWDLLQSIATISLYEEKLLDKLDETVKAYDVFAHQVLSTLLENYGLAKEEYYYLNKTLSSFSDISDDEFKDITNYMLEKGYIEILETEVITGINIEKLMRIGSFYNQFVSNQVYTVYNGKGKIGELDIRPDIQVDAHIYLAGLVWKIDKLYTDQKKIIVSKANDGKAPKFFSAGDVDVSTIIRDRMKYILENPNDFKFNSNVDSIIEELSSEYTEEDYTFVIKENLVGLITFKNSKINRSLALMLNVASETTNYIANEREGIIYGPDTTKYFDEIRINPISEKKIFEFLKKREAYLENFLISYKYMILVPLELRIKYLINNLLDIHGAYEYLGISEEEISF